MLDSDSFIKVYLTKETFGWIIGKKGWRIKSIARDTNTKINLNRRDIDSYFSIEGNIEDVHRSRIILQDLEKAYYRKQFLTKMKQGEEDMNNIVNRLREQITKFDEHSIR